MFVEVVDIRIFDVIPQFGDFRNKCIKKSAILYFISVQFEKFKYAEASLYYYILYM
jgi:hypothetical protein